MRVAKKVIWWDILLFAFYLSLFFTGIDWIVHRFLFEQVEATWAVPFSYFINKLWISFVAAFLFGMVLENYRAFQSSWAFGITGFAVAILLQVRYFFIASYSLWFHLILILEHTLLLVGLFFAWRGIQKILKQ